MASERILIVEDEKDLVKALRYNLEQKGYKVFVAHDGEAALALFRKERPNLVVLDVMLPKMDGFEVCRILRTDSQVPILMLTAKSDEAHRIFGLELGADDYLTKPFSVQELMARIKTILRRTNPAPSGEQILKVGELVIDFGRYTVQVKGKPVILRSKEFDFLKALLLAKGQVLTREKLLEQVWGLDESMDIDSRTIDQHIARLREKLGTVASRIITIKNVGYRFETD